MREKVLKLSGPLLKDNTMLTSVTQNKEMIYVAEERRLEAQVKQWFVRDQLQILLFVIVWFCFFAGCVV